MLGLLSFKRKWPSFRINALPNKAVWMADLERLVKIKEKQFLSIIFLSSLF